jgi:hypothetical protein
MRTATTGLTGARATGRSTIPGPEGTRGAGRSTDLEEPPTREKLTIPGPELMAPGSAPALRMDPGAVRWSPAMTSGCAPDTIAESAGPSAAFRARRAAAPSKSIGASDRMPSSARPGMTISMSGRMAISTSATPRAVGRIWTGEDGMTSNGRPASDPPRLPIRTGRGPHCAQLPPPPGRLPRQPGRLPPPPGQLPPPPGRLPRPPGRLRRQRGPQPVRRCNRLSARCRASSRATSKLDHGAVPGPRRAEALREDLAEVALEEVAAGREISGRMPRSAASDCRFGAGRAIGGEGAVGAS